jgi:hypothetical protein
MAIEVCIEVVTVMISYCINLILDMFVLGMLAIACLYLSLYLCLHCNDSTLANTTPWILSNGKKESALLDDRMMAFMCARPVALLLPIHTQERLISIGALKKPAWQIPERKRIGTF